MRLGAAAGRPRSRRRNRKRSAISIAVKPATQTGTNGICGNSATTSSAPSQRICAGESGARGATRAPRRRSKPRLGAIAPFMDGAPTLAAAAGRSASAVSAARRCSRPCAAGSEMPGAASENGRATRSAASTHAASLAIRASGSSDPGSACQASSAGPPPPLPSNCFVYQSPPRATAFHATRCSGSPG